MTFVPLLCLLSVCLTYKQTTNFVSEITWFAEGCRIPTLQWEVTGERHMSPQRMVGLPTICHGCIPTVIIAYVVDRYSS